MVETTTDELRPTSIKRFEQCAIGERRIDELVTRLVPRRDDESGEDLEETIDELKSRLLQGGAVAAAVPIPVVLEETNTVIDGWLTVEAYRALALSDGSIPVKVRLFPGAEIEAVELLLTAEKRFSRRHTRTERMEALRRFHFNHPEVPKKTLAEAFHLQRTLVVQICNDIDARAERTPNITRSNGKPYTLPTPAAADTPPAPPRRLVPSQEDIEYEQMLDKAASHFVAHPDASLTEAAASLKLPLAAVEEARERQKLRDSLAALDAGQIEVDPSRLDKAVQAATERLKPEITTYARLESNLVATGSHLRDHLDEITRVELAEACRSILRGLEGD